MLRRKLGAESTTIKTIYISNIEQFLLQIYSQKKKNQIEEIWLTRNLFSSSHLHKKKTKKCYHQQAFSGCQVCTAHFLSQSSARWFTQCTAQKKHTQLRRGTAQTSYASARLSSGQSRAPVDYATSTRAVIKTCVGKNKWAAHTQASLGVVLCIPRLWGSVAPSALCTAWRKAEEVDLNRNHVEWERRRACSCMRTCRGSPLVPVRLVSPYPSRILIQRLR